MAEPTAPRFYDRARVAGYTDGVFAIAATLLVLDLTTTAIGEPTGDAELWAALGAMWPSFLSFCVSFVLLSGLWVIHLGQFRSIARVDLPLLWLNSIRLLFVVLIPFTTSLVSQYSDFYAGRMLLPINFFFAALLGFASWAWAAARSGHLLADDARANARAENAGGLAAVLCGFVAMIISPWVGSWAFVAYALNGPLTVLLKRRGAARVARAPSAPR
ncbi:TMEM175 family protein [Microbacterium sp. 1P10UB]|uniref:TMEM175 family protein n=1 Tax=unclassified Microbacterium TaxID=2609290 RepID=UPI0039A3A788